MTTASSKLTGLRAGIVFLALRLGPGMTQPSQAQLLNGDFSSGKTNFVSDYRYDFNACYLAGYYTLQTNSQLANINFVKFGDHTSGTGPMLLANGHSSNNLVVWSQTITTMTNTPYVFSAWATSADPQNPAALRFLANGNQLGLDLPLTSDAGRWQQFIATWNSGSNTQVTLAIVDTNLTNAGNDFALDDLAFHPVTNAVADVMIYTAIELSWVSQTGSIYQVQYSTAETPGRWIDAGTPIESMGSVTTFLNSTRDEPRKFYRVLQLQ